MKKKISEEKTYLPTQMLQTHMYLYQYYVFLTINMACVQSLHLHTGSIPYQYKDVDPAINTLSIALFFPLFNHSYDHRNILRYPPVKRKKNLL